MSKIDLDLLQGEAVHLRQGVDLYVCRHPGHRPALVFLHVGLGNRFDWRSHFYLAQHLHFSEAGHIVMAEYPEAVNEAIANWLTECELVQAQKIPEQITDYNRKKNPA